MKFNVGDKVKWNGSEEKFVVSIDEEKKSFLNSKEEHIIRYISDDNTCLLKGYSFWFNLEWFDKADEKIEYKIEEKYIVSDNEDFLNDDDNIRILLAYMPNNEHPFICISSNDEEDYENDCQEFVVARWKYAKPIPKKQYKPYSEPKLEWIGKTIKRKGIYITKIVAIGKDFVITEDEDQIWFDNLYKNFIWYDDKSPCGDEIN